jgi:hypothetical protein
MSDEEVDHAVSRTAVMGRTVAVERFEVANAFAAYVFSR